MQTTVLLVNVLTVEQHRLFDTPKSTRKGIQGDVGTFSHTYTQKTKQRYASLLVSSAIYRNGGGGGGHITFSFRIYVYSDQLYPQVMTNRCFL